MSMKTKENTFDDTYNLANNKTQFEKATNCDFKGIRTIIITNKGKSHIRGTDITNTKKFNDRYA